MLCFRLRVLIYPYKLAMCFIWTQYCVVLPFQSSVSWARSALESFLSGRVWQYLKTVKVNKFLNFQFETFPILTELYCTLYLFRHHVSKLQTKIIICFSCFISIHLSHWSHFIVVHFFSNFLVNISFLFYTFYDKYSIILTLI